MKNITAEMFIEFNKKQHKHGIPIKAKEKIDSIISHLIKSDKNDLGVLSEILFYFIQEHPFIDGNKRTASFALDYYLKQKRYKLDNSTRLHLILKYTTDEEATPRKIYLDLKKIISRYNSKFKP